MAANNYDVIMVGGGVMGCAIAYYLLKADSRLKIALLEQDPTYAKASTPLSDGNTRLQFNIKENIQMSLYGLEVLATFAEDMVVAGDKPDVAFRQQGNLFIIDEASREETQQGLALQQSLGAAVEWLTPDEVQQLYPLYNLAGCVGGTWGRLDGTMSPLAVLLAYKKKAIALGAHFIQAEVSELLRGQNRISGVKLASGDTLAAPVVVNAAGPWAAKIAQTVGVNLPIQSIKREVTVVETPAQPDKILPAIFFPSGLYGIHEGEGLFMWGKSLPDDPITYDDFTWERSRFEELLWPELVELIPAFDRLKVVRGWAGLYEVNTFDGNALLGEWPEVKGFFLANGFSGHGFQQCHAVGRYLAETITAQPPSLDLSIFSPRRILENKPVFESRRKII
ncbi:MAG: FAD-binding oxidoreductase [Anaerolineae bacterium]